MTTEEIQGVVEKFHKAWADHDLATATRQSRIETRLETVDKTLAQMTEAMNNFREGIGKFQEATDSLRTWASNLNIKVDRLTGEVAVLNERKAQVNGMKHAEATGAAMGKTMSAAKKTGIGGSILAAVAAILYLLIDRLTKG